MSSLVCWEHNIRFEPDQIGQLFITSKVWAVYKKWKGLLECILTKTEFLTKAKFFALVKRVFYIISLYKQNWSSLGAKKYFSWRYSIIMVLIMCIILGALLSLPLFEVWGEMGYEEKTFSCTIKHKNGGMSLRGVLSQKRRFLKSVFKLSGRKSG